MAAPFAKKIYNGKAWTSCRTAYAAYRNGICERCGAPGKEVHHKKALTPANINDPEVVYGWNNLELLCTDCHIAEHEKKKNLKRGRPAKECDVRISFDAAGKPVPKGKIVIVWGAPASGKTTYAMEHMQHMDVIVDLDRIYECFAGSTFRTDEPQKRSDYLPYMLAVRDAVYKIALSREYGIGTTWIVAGLPSRADRETIKTRFPGAQFVHMDADIETAMRRADADDARTDKAYAHKVIEDYFRRYEAE